MHYAFDNFHKIYTETPAYPSEINILDNIWNNPESFSVVLFYYFENSGIFLEIHFSDLKTYFIT